MDNSYHAILMAGAALMFLIGISVAILNYSRVLDINGKILTNSEYFSRTAESFQKLESAGVDLHRKYSGAEIARMILEMHDIKTEIVYMEDDTGTTKAYTTSDISFEKITVDGTTFERGLEKYKEMVEPASSKASKLKSLIGSNKEYKVVSANYDGQNSTIEFK